jgi:hypothetical protein
MVLDIVHKIVYEIQFNQPVDYFDVILQKQIDLRLKIKGNVKKIEVIELNNENEVFKKSTFYEKYKIIFEDYTNFRTSFLSLINNPEKYSIYKKIYEKIKQDELYKDKYYNNDIYKAESYEEFEYNFDLVLEEFKLFLDKFEFDENLKKIIDSFVLDEKINTNIKFIGWRDYWITV